MLDWNSLLDKIRSEIGEESFQTWFRPAKFLSFENEVLYLEVPNRFYHRWLTEKYLDTVLRVLVEQTGHTPQIVLKIPERESTSTQTLLVKEQFASEDETQYTFGNFVVAESNRLPYQAALQISNFNSPAYHNPCYIYSLHHGLGKTHLLKAIRNYVYRLRPDKNVYYIPANELSKIVYLYDQQNKINVMHSYFQSYDLVLFDDIQTLSRLSRAQDEFLFLINSLYDNKKQIVVTSDRVPRDMQNLDDKVRSRLSGGLIAEVALPDFELKKRILINKLTYENISTSKEVIDFICSLNDFDLDKIFQYISKLIEKKSVTIDSIKKMFDVDLSDPLKQIEKIQSSVCLYFNVTRQQLLSQKKSHLMSVAKQIAMHLSRENTGLSFAQIGEIFGGRDHSTVLKAHRTIKTKLLENEELQHLVNEIKRLLRT
jgi:chromosomal replication initiator protein